MFIPDHFVRDETLSKERKGKSLELYSAIFFLKFRKTHLSLLHTHVQFNIGQSSKGVYKIKLDQCYKFKFKFIFSHLFSYNITTIKNKKEVRTELKYTLS